VGREGSRRIEEIGEESIRVSVSPGIEEVYESIKMCSPVSEDVPCR